MKYLKTLGLAAVAAAALMAFVGASSAPATVLCTTTPTSGICPNGSQYFGEIHAVSTSKWVTTDTFKTIECDESTVAMTPTNSGSATQTVSGPVSTLTASGHCNCTVVIVQTGTLEIHAIGDTGNGTVTSNGLTETVNCSTIFGPVHCNFIANNKDLGTLVGGSPATMSITVALEEEETETSILCDETIWHVSYSVTTPSGLWVATST